MKNRIAFFALLLVCAVGAFAQAKSQPRFQGLDGSFIKFGGMTAGFREFELRVDFDPFHFVAKGKVAAGPQTADLDILTDEIGVAFSYFEQSVADAQGNPQYPAIGEIVVFVQDEPTRIKDVVIELLPPQNDAKGKAALASVPNLMKDYRASVPTATRTSKEDSDITAALADPWSMGQKEAEQKVARQPPPPAPAPTAVPAPAAVPVTVAPAPQAAVTPAPVAATPVASAPQVRSTPVRQGGKIRNMKASEPEEATPSSNGAPSDKDGFMGNKTNRTRLGIGLAAAGAILVVYGVLQHGTVTERLSKMQDGERAQAGIANEPFRSMSYDQLHVTTGAPITGGESYNDLENQKKGAETRRNLALGLGTICVGGSIVMFTF